MRQMFGKNQKGTSKKKLGDDDLARILNSKETKIPTPPVDLEWMKLEQRIEMAEAKAATSPKSYWGWFMKPGLAMAMAVVLAISSLMVYRSQMGDTYQTNRQEWQTIVLADSSEVRLNCESQLKVRKGYNQKARQVVLNGEAYFKVRKSNHPFQISTDQGLVTVVGTEFNVRSRDAEMEVAVNKGVVSVQSDISVENSITLTQGKMTRVAMGGLPELPTDVQFDQYPGWMHGTLTVNQMDLIDLIQEIERRFDVVIDVNDPDVHHVEITGLFDASEVTPVLESICLLVQKDLRIANNRMIIE